MSRRRGCRSPITVILPKFSYLARSRHYGVSKVRQHFHTTKNDRRRNASGLSPSSNSSRGGGRTCQLQLAGGSADTWLRHPFSIPTHPKSARPPWAPRRISCQSVAAARLPDHGRVGGIFLRPARDCGSDDVADDQRRAFRRFGQAVVLPGAVTGMPATAGRERVSRKRRDHSARRDGPKVRYKPVRGYKSEGGMLNGFGLRRRDWSGRDGLELSEPVAAPRRALRRGSCALRNPPQDDQPFLGRLRFARRKR